MQRNTAGYPETIDIAKAQAKRLSAAMGGKRELSQAQALEMVAKLHGDGSWGEMRQALTEDIKHPESLKREHMLFTPLDLIRTTERLFKGQNIQCDFVSGHIFDLCLKLVPSGIASTLIMPAFKESFLDIAMNRSNFFINGKTYFETMANGPLSINVLFDTMVSDAVPLMPPLMEVDRWLSDSTISVRDIPEIHGRHTLAYVKDLNRLAAALKKEGHQVIHLMSPDGLQQLDAGFNSSSNRAVDPGNILKYLLHNGLSWYDLWRDKKTVILLPYDDFFVSGVDVLLAQLRSVYGHVIFFTLDDDFSKRKHPNPETQEFLNVIWDNVGQHWRQP